MKLKLSVFILLLLFSFSAFAKDTYTSVVVEQRSDNAWITKKMVLQQFIAKASQDSTYQLRNLVVEAKNNPIYTHISFGLESSQDQGNEMRTFAKIGEVALDAMVGVLSGKNPYIPAAYKIVKEIVKSEYQKQQSEVEKIYLNAAPDAVERQSLMMDAIIMGQSNPEIITSLNKIFKKEMGFDLNSSQEEIFSKAPELAHYIATLSNGTDTHKLQKAMEKLDEDIAQLQAEAKKTDEVQAKKTMYDNARILQNNLVSIAGHFDANFARKLSVVSSSAIDIVQAADALSGIKDVSEMLTLGNLASLSTGVGAVVNLVSFFANQAQPSDTEIILQHMDKHFEKLHERIDGLHKHIQLVHESLLDALKYYFKDLHETIQQNQSISIAHFQDIKNDLQSIQENINAIQKNQQDQMRGGMQNDQNLALKMLNYYKEEIKDKDNHISISELKEYLTECKIEGCISSTKGPFLLNKTLISDVLSQGNYQNIFNKDDFFLKMPFSDTLNILLELLFQNRYPKILEGDLHDLSNPQVWADATQVAMGAIETCLAQGEGEKDGFCELEPQKSLEKFEKKGKLIQSLIDSIFYDVDFKTGQKQIVNLTTLRARFLDYAEQLLFVEQDLLQYLPLFMKKAGYAEDVNILKTIDEQEFPIPTPMDFNIEHTAINELHAFLEKRIPKSFLLASKLNLGKLEVTFSHPQWTVSGLEQSETYDRVDGYYVNLKGYLVFDIFINFMDYSSQTKIKLASFSIRKPSEEAFIFSRVDRENNTYGGIYNRSRSKTAFENYTHQASFISEVISQIEKTLEGSENGWITQLLEDTQYARQHGVSPTDNLYNYHSVFKNMEPIHFRKNSFLSKINEEGALLREDLALNFLTVDPSKTLFQLPTKSEQEIATNNEEVRRLLESVHNHLEGLILKFQEEELQDNHPISLTDHGKKLDGQKILLHAMIHLGLHRSSKEDEILKLFFNSPIESVQILSSTSIIAHIKDFKQEGLKRLQMLACYLSGAEEGKNLIPQFHETNPSLTCDDVKEFTIEGILKDRINAVETPELLEDVLASLSQLHQKIDPANKPASKGLLARIWDTINIFN